MAFTLCSLSRNAAGLAVPGIFGHSVGRLPHGTSGGTTVVRDLSMCNQSEWIVREAFRAYDRGDVTRMMDFVDPEVDWTYRDPELESSEPQTCHGRGELEKALRRQANRGLRAQLEEVIAAGDRVMLVMRTPGIDEYRRRQADDRTYDIVTVRDGLIVGLKACRDRSEARSLAGIG
jgi:ketosteroid isomerase-like protein